jgi:hypothetical protein
VYMCVCVCVCISACLFIQSSFSPFDCVIFVCDNVMYEWFLTVPIV